jgi:hypothetical protein
MNPLHSITAAIILSLTALATPAPAEQPTAASAPRAAADARFDHAAELLPKDPATAKAEFVKAATAYEQLAFELRGQRARASAFYNAGASHQLAGDLGRAVLDFRRAELLAPITPGLRERLTAARAEAKGEPTSVAATPTSDTWQWVHDMDRSIPRPDRWLWLVVPYAFFWAMLLLRIVLPPASRLRPHQLFLWIPAGMCVISTSALVKLWREDAITARDVVILSDTIGRAEPDDLVGTPASGAAFKPGRELRVVEERLGGNGQPWLRVRPADAPSDSPDPAAWIPATSAARVIDGSTPVLSPTR